MTREPIRPRIDEDYIRAVKSRDGDRVGVLRMLRAGVLNAEKAKRSALADDEVLDVLIKEVKTRRESLEEFEKGGRPELASAERFAIEVLAIYLPDQLDEAALDDIVNDAISTLKPEAIANERAALGQVMRIVMPKVKGRADGTAVAAAVQRMMDKRKD